MTTRQEIRVPELNEPFSHYTDAVRFGNVLYISGCAPLDRAGALVGGADPAAQTRQVLRNMQLILRAAHAEFADVLSVTVYLADIAHRAAINPVRREFFGAARPASTLIEVSAFVLPEMLVEIDAVAGIPVSACAARRSNQS